jgi:hypothetical protein
MPERQYTIEYDGLKYYAECPIHGLISVSFWFPGYKSKGAARRAIVEHATEFHGLTAGVVPVIVDIDLTQWEVEEG